MISKIALASLVIAPCAFAGKFGSVNGTNWSNGENSRMFLVEDSFGRLSGAFTTGVGCDSNKALPIMGEHNGRRVTFIVNFPGCKSTATWNGELSADGKTIKALWELVTEKADPQQWDNTEMNEDLFKLVDDKVDDTTTLVGQATITD